ncbi:MAG: replicative DNA helicase [Pirellulaceae bacterium]
MSGEVKNFRKDGAVKKPISFSELQDRSPPYDLQAEAAVLGSMMIDPRIVKALLVDIREEDFYDSAQQKIFAHIKSIYDEGRSMDPMILANSLKKKGQLDEVGGVAMLADLARSVPHAAHASFYAKIVVDKAVLRRLIDTSSEILHEAYGGTTEVSELVATAEAKILKVQDERNATATSSISDVLKEAMKRIDARLRGEKLEGGVMTHFADFDKMTGGLHNGELVILAARPSMGKTALAMNIAEHATLKGKAPVLFVSLEMSAIELADRLLCSVARVNGSRLRNGTISSEDRQRLVGSAMQISQAPLFVDDSPSRSVSEIAAVARRIDQQVKQKQGHLGLIVIDYLQLIEPENQRDPRQEQVAKIARRLKILARQQQVPVLCLAQLNRQAEEGKDHTPRLSHLRESGAIEQDADVVMFVHREEYYHRGEAATQYAGQAQIIIAKQRNGPIGEVDLLWEREYTRFLDKAPERLSEFDGYSGFSSPGGF